MSVIRMTVPISSKYTVDQEQIEYTLQFSEPVAGLDQSWSLLDALRELGVGDMSFYQHEIRFTLDKNADLKRHCLVVANYLRWLIDFGGGVEFTLACPHCGHKESFAL